MKILCLLVPACCKSPINPITNTNPSIVTKNVKIYSLLMYMLSVVQKLLTKGLTLQILIRKVRSSNIGPETGYADWDSRRYFLSFQRIDGMMS
jgi:hypothetical protein